MDGQNGRAGADGHHGSAGLALTDLIVAGTLGEDQELFAPLQGLQGILHGADV